MVSETYLVDVCDETVDKYRFGFNGQEKVNEISGVGNHNTAEFWEYDTRVARRWNTDPVFKEYESPYVAFGNSTIWLVDPNGADTIYVAKNEAGKWGINKVQIAKGNDVFRVTYEDHSRIVEFSEGEYGKRINVLNLENTEDYTLGIMHISGATGDGSTVFAVTPGGTPSTKINSGKRLPDDVYDVNPTDGHGFLWVQPLIAYGEKSGSVSERGVKIHPAASSGKTNAAKWTEGCYVVSEDYELDNGKIIYEGSQSKKTSKNVNKHLGSTKDYDSIGKKKRPGSDFKNGIDHKLIQKNAYEK